MDLTPIVGLIREGGALVLAVVMLYAVAFKDPPLLYPKSRLDDEKAGRKEATEGWKGQTAATERLADALEKRNEIDQERSKLLEAVFDELRSKP